MRSTFVLAAVLSAVCLPVQAVLGQTDRLPEHALGLTETMDHLSYLASDDLLGREAGTPGADSAARYIATAFEEAGLIPPTPEFLQEVPLVRTAGDPASSVHAFGRSFKHGADMVHVAGSAMDRELPIVYVGYGTEDDFKGADVGGKAVLARAGTANGESAFAAWRLQSQKRRTAAAHGASALIELYDHEFAWHRLRDIISDARTEIAGEDAGIPHFWIHDADAAIRKAAMQGGNVAIRTGGAQRSTFSSSNVVGLVEGADPELRDEYVILGAHYDHLGAGLQKHGATPADSIFNGARDNGMGIVAVLNAAKVLAADPPARSVLFITYTAEEMGLLGSRYYVDNPLLPLENAVFNLNVDTGGYSDTTIVTLVGLGRTTADDAIRRGAAPFRIELIGDPSPGEGLFDRSDNVRFARKGIPAPTFSPGFRDFSDAGIANYYHQPADEADETFDYAYLLRFTQAYARAARLIADMREAPRWVEGDKYESAGLPRN